MKHLFAIFAMSWWSALASAADLKFRMQEIDTTLKCGYGVVIADVNGDGKPDTDIRPPKVNVAIA